MITAKEALFKSIQKAKNVEIPEEIEKGILDSCNKGCWFYKHQGYIDYPVSNLLESLGYKINRFVIWKISY